MIEWVDEWRAISGNGKIVRFLDTKMIDDGRMDGWIKENSVTIAGRDSW